MSTKAFSDYFLLIKSITKADPYENMATDELLSQSSKIAKDNNANGLFRFYGWKTKCATFGYAQSYNQVLADNPNLILVRRPTGGGTVIHGNDLTYSMTIFKESPLFTLNRSELYLLVHKTIKNALQELNINCEIRKEAKSNSGYYKCFEKPVSGDLLLKDGRKIAGAAQKQTKDSILIQGSIAADILNLPIEKFKQNFLQEFEILSDVKMKIFDLSPEILAKIANLAKNKYQSDLWNKERKI